MPRPVSPSASPIWCIAAIRTAAARASTPASSHASSPPSGTRSRCFSGQPYPELADPAAADACPEPRPVPAREPVPGAVAVGVQDPHRRRPSSPSCARRASPSRARSACGFAACCGTAAPISTSSTTTSASAPGLAKMVDDGWPMLATLHHPITVDRDLDLAHAKRAWKRLTLRRWYGFLDMQTQRRPPDPAARHRLRVVAARHRRPDARRAGSPARRPGRRRPGGVPAPARTCVGSRAAS